MGVNTKTADIKVDCTQCDDACVNCGLCVVKKPDVVNKIVNFGAARIGANSGVTGAVDAKLASMIDHTMLSPETTREDLIKVCEEAKQYHFATVCVNASNIPLVARMLRGSGVKPIAVVGFPLGAASPQSKTFESRQAIKDGAEEIDMVINIGALKSKEYKLVYDDILAVVEVSKPHKVKVIIEASNLNYDEKVAACVLSKTAGAAFVKTSTGFGKGGATVEDVALMRRVVGCDMEVKASGGIRTTDDAEAMVQAGANRIGASASVAIVTGKKAKTGTY
ncbi:MAG: deoxyribose-phosphate aldolase [Gammaproteobacteria bacterium]|nr:deoxyribose-phosphate aldolase [Gammaproteobacteria bacterium]